MCLAQGAAQSHAPILSSLASVRLRTMAQFLFDAELFDEQKELREQISEPQRHKEFIDRIAKLWPAADPKLSVRGGKLIYEHFKKEILRDLRTYGEANLLDFGKVNLGLSRQRKAREFTTKKGKTVKISACGAKPVVKLMSVKGGWNCVEALVDECEESARSGSHTASASQATAGAKLRGSAKKP